MNGRLSSCGVGLPVSLLSYPPSAGASEYPTQLMISRPSLPFPSSSSHIQDNEVTIQNYTDYFPQHASVISSIQYASGYR